MRKMTYFLAFVVFGAALLAGPAARAQKGGTQLLDKAAWTFSKDEGKTFPLKAPAGAPITARATFTVEDPAEVGCLWVVPGRVLRKVSYSVNGKPVAGPLKGMTYIKSFPIDPAVVLKKGENVFVVRGAVKGKVTAATRPQTRLVAVPRSAVGIQSGPALGAVGPDYFSVTCRTNMPATVTVKTTVLSSRIAGGTGDLSEKSAASKRGFYHRLRIPLPRGTEDLSYTVTAAAGGHVRTAGPFKVNLPDFEGESFRFVITGDSRENWKSWRAVAAHMQKAKPEIVIFSGDMVSAGGWDYQWDEQWFGPARLFLATIPLFPVMGNHEYKSPAYYELFYTPSPDGKAQNWTQTVGTVLFIGIDGAQDWSRGSKNCRWLESVLKDAKEKFVFLVSHYPAFSSGKHGKYGEKPMVQAREAVMPILAKHKATAFVAGHDHNYERSEPPPGKGVTAITSGGAGAKLRPKSGGAARKNPYSKAFQPVLHYCLFEVKGDSCEMVAVHVPSGKVFDRKVFHARR